MAKQKSIKIVSKNNNLNIKKKTTMMPVVNHISKKTNKINKEFNTEIEIVKYIKKMKIMKIANIVKITNIMKIMNILKLMKLVKMMERKKRERIIM
jgi:hypothetical protein